MSLVLVNASPLIALGKLNRLHLLVDLYGTIHVPRAVYREVVVEGLARGALEASTVQIFVEYHKLPILDASESAIHTYKPETFLDAGEMQLLSLARTFPDALVLIDDEAAREEARKLGVPVRGTVGILAQAYREGLLSPEECELLLLEIAARADIWISDKLCQQVREQLKREPRQS